MNRKLIAFLGISVLTVATTGNFTAAATNAPPTTQGSTGEKHEEPFARIRAALAQLDLTPQQKTTIRGIFEEARTKLKALKGTTDAKTQARDIFQKARKDILAQLDETQKAKLKEILGKDRADSTTGSTK